MTAEIKKHQSGNYSEYSIEVFPGIIIQHYFCEGGKIWRCSPSAYKIDEDILIHHCKYGRFETLLADGAFHSLGMGKMTLSSSLCNLVEVESMIPAELYEGISVVFSYKHFPPWLTALFSTWGIDFPSLVSKFNLSKRWHYIAANSGMEKIFLDLYDLFDTRTVPLIQLKVMELMHHISVDTVLNGKNKMPAPQTHSKIVKKICSMMVNTTCPIADLVSQEAISYNLFQKIFKSVYGTSPNLYRQEYKMNRAASLLKNTDKTILDISLEQGYENPGKFAATFKKIMGFSPGEFRRLETTVKYR